MWILNNEINVRKRGRCVQLILTWIDREKGERKKNFTELFREV